MEVNKIIQIYEKDWTNQSPAEKIIFAKSRLELITEGAEWDESRLKYWNKRGIGKNTLDKFKFSIIPIRGYRDLKSNETFYDEGACAYEYGSYIAGSAMSYIIFLPEENKHILYVNPEGVQGLKQINKEADHLFIAINASPVSSFYDMLTLNELGYNTVGFQMNEDISFYQKCIDREEIKNTNLRNVYLLHDADSKALAEMLSEKNSLWKKWKKEDIQNVSDLLRDNGKEKAREIIDGLINSNSVADDSVAHIEETTVLNSESQTTGQDKIEDSDSTQEKKDPQRKQPIDSELCEEKTNGKTIAEKSTTDSISQEENYGSFCNSQSNLNKNIHTQPIPTDFTTKNRPYDYLENQFQNHYIKENEPSNRPTDHNFEKKQIKKFGEKLKREYNKNRLEREYRKILKEKYPYRSASTNPEVCDGKLQCPEGYEEKERGVWMRTHGVLARCPDCDELSLHIHYVQPRGKNKAVRVKYHAYCSCAGENFSRRKDEILTPEMMEKFDAKKFLYTGIDELDELTNGRWNNNLLLLLGRPKRGKTYACCYFVLRILMNDPNSSVLFIEQDMKKEDLGSYFDNVSGGKEWRKKFMAGDKKRLVIKRLSDRSPEGTEEAIVNFRNENKGKEVYVFIDSLFRMGIDVNKIKEATGLFDLLSTAADENQCQIAVIHHITKSIRNSNSRQKDQNEMKTDEDKRDDEKVWNNFLGMTEENTLGSTAIPASFDHIIAVNWRRKDGRTYLKNLGGRGLGYKEMTSVDTKNLRENIYENTQNQSSWKDTSDTEDSLYNENIQGTSMTVTEEQSNSSWTKAL